MMVDDEWTDLVGCQVSNTHSHRIGAKSCPTTIFLYFGRSPEIGVLGRSGSSWFKRSASLCPVDGGGGAPVDSAPAVWTELSTVAPTDQPNPTSVKKVKFKFKDCGSGPGGEKKLKQRKLKTEGWKVVTNSFR